MEQQRDYINELFKRCDDDFTISDNYNNNLLKKLEDSNKPIEVKFKNNFLNFFYKKKEGFSLIFSGILMFLINSLGLSTKIAEIFMRLKVLFFLG
ncbi:MULTISPECIES: hypothetical protein [Clostridium]|uniref:Uncharacterized protein n=1 Tax=Clostridium faecium TaxID=2762223 RepID=A0ABR8YQW2_9CLOT|nr:MULTISPECIES: hypothetical protein [Clostridium]MBD8046636.1 hypothetical protein [Clostridium faecium]MDU1349350.1 hypothetical protein [Clostridium argentinense]